MVTFPSPSSFTVPLAEHVVGENCPAWLL